MSSKLKKLDKMLDDALSGNFSAQNYNESLMSKIESKMSRFLDASKLRREQIESEQERVRTLISDISHQTKTPIANIALYSQLLSEQNLTENQAKLTEQIGISAEKLSFLIQALVKTSRLESGIIQIKPVRENVLEFVKSAVNQCLSLAKAKNITLEFEETDNKVTALLDSRWCGEAVFNIIENAVKYTPKNGKVTVNIIEYEMFVCVNISDNGRGIREEDLPKIFTRFWRGDSSEQGVGVGLYLAREIITACGGYIKVMSEIGKGSKFSVFLSKV